MFLATRQILADATGSWRLGSDLGQGACTELSTAIACDRAISPSVRALLAYERLSLDVGVVPCRGDRLEVFPGDGAGHLGAGGGARRGLFGRSRGDRWQPVSRQTIDHALELSRLHDEGKCYGNRSDDTDYLLDRWALH